MPVRIGAEAEIEAWLATFEGVAVTALSWGRTQKELRRWKRKTPGHRTFTVVRHPIDRAHAGFCSRVLTPGPACLSEIRALLRHRYAVPLPEGAPGPEYDRAQHRAALLAHLAFVKGNLGGQTSAGTDASWASQTALVQGLGNVMLPDLILRHDDLAARLPALAMEMGRTAPPFRTAAGSEPFDVGEILNAEIERAVRDVYQRDYVMFGFSPRAG